MHWSKQQEEALDAASRWYQNPTQQVFRLFGYAGTGKTTLAKHLANDLGGLVLFGAYTGKAAHVLRQKGCPNATTLHSLIYLPMERSRSKLHELQRQLTKTEDPALMEKLQEAIREEQALLRQPAFAVNPDSDLHEASLLIIDECSMVSRKMAEDILQFNIPVLVLGDPGQLPPVKSGGYFTDVEPDFTLTEIHRQAAEDPILQLATKARNNEVIKLGTYGEHCRVIPRSDLKKEMALAYEQALVGTNGTRRSVNARYRQLHNRSSLYPEEGDRLVCLKNDHQAGLLNGGIWATNQCLQRDSFLDISMTNEEGRHIFVTAHAAVFDGEEIPYWAKREAQEFDYGYALTVHKSQGSQWDSVLLFDESGSFPSRDRRRWLYTGITRAVSKLLIVKG